MIVFISWKYSFFRIRIRSETDEWCPLNKISRTTYEYIQIDLENLTVITLIELQGKFSQGPVNKTTVVFLFFYKII
jgi:discoidin domain receptor family protein 2